MRHGAHASENNRTDAQYTTLAARGGIAGVGWGSLKSNEWLTELGKVHATGISIAIGSDINGMVVQPAQRSGCGPTTPCVTYNAAFPQMTHGSKTFDYNADGVANIGLFPDLLRDVEGQGPKGKQMVAELFEGAEGFASMWEKAWKLRSHAPSGAPPANAISNIRASYGRNCGMTADRGDITSFVSDKCVGQMSCRYNFTWEKWGGDPAPSTCSKEIVIDYKCGGNAKQKKVMHRRTPQGVDIACP
jgi:hypothetical protein